MSRIRHCPNPACRNYSHPAHRWYVHIGSYDTIAHGTVQRVRCRVCGRTASTQTFSVNYYAKRRLPLEPIYRRLRGGSSLRDVARTYRVSPTAIRSVVYRLARQSMAAHTRLVSDWTTTDSVVFDGLQSILTSRDFPVHITTALTGTSQFLLDMTHAVLRRGGRMRPAQIRRRDEKERIWKPNPGALRSAISLLVHEIPHFHRMPTPHSPLLVDTDNHPLYRKVLRQDMAFRFWWRFAMAVHHGTPGVAPRTGANPLFAVNYFDILLRHRMKEHSRKTIAFGRHGVDQMHRAWIMAYDHNYVQPWRIRRGTESKTHAERAGIRREAIRRMREGFFRDRIDLRGYRMSLSMLRVWTGDIAGPPVRWRTGASRPLPAPIPRFALRDLASCTHFQ